MWHVTLSIHMSQPFHNGSIATVIFVDAITQVTDAYDIKCDNHFINTLEDNIIQWGDPNNKLISDQGQSIVSHKVEDILHTICIDNWQTEPC
jgi:hypothetical protein